MFETLIFKTIANQITNREKIQKARKKKKLKKQKHDKEMIEMFGKTRYTLSYWFGIGVLFAGNTKEKVIDRHQQPSNVIFLEQYKLAKAK